ncbi:hypothetical protein RND71_030052 [Anisodus tanguticus]|uniref:Uncharacterized protein n=1 Tax=Anisodus tanguticus TaxID=243964 RepID=A0AAE1V6Y3_9SOLA|nr:hypothetical protein RND71_030052 [Anisodus tanguticus]
MPTTFSNGNVMPPSPSSNPSNLVSDVLSTSYGTMMYKISYGNVQSSSPAGDLPLFLDSAMHCNKTQLLAVEELYFITDSSRLENDPKGIANLQKANRSIEDFHKEKNDCKDTFSGSEMIGSESSPSSLPHARLLNAAKIKGARWPSTHNIHVASQSGNKDLYRDIIEMDYYPPHRQNSKPYPTCNRVAKCYTND